MTKEGREQRVLRMGIQTLTGARAQGFFIPYRYADQVEAPGPYPAFEALFQTAEPAFQDVLDEIAARADTLSSFDGPAPLPRWTQDWFPRADGAAAYALIASRRPKKIVEVGSGHSTRFMARAAADAGAETQITCIDPAPRAALMDLKVDWIEAVLSEAHFPLFDALAPGDVAFFDSSHLLMPGTDVDMILNRILPRLAKGVIVHIHDILLPDPYPDQWSWRGYAEQNALGGWLLSGALRPIFSSRYAVTRMGADKTLAALPMPTGAIETSLWTERT